MESKKPIHCTLTDAELISKAEKWIYDLCHGATWTMHVPARPNEDPDLVFAELNSRFKGRLNEQPGPRWVKVDISEIDKARFWTKVAVTDYCWEWSANRCQDGYGMFKLNGKDVKASRVAYAIVNGEIPADLHVLHKCDNPCCVNPDHLFTGTHQDNMLDRQRKGRGKVLGRASRFHGVAFRKDSNNWRAQAFDGRKHLSLGSFKTEEEAAKARDKAVIEMGLDLPLNFPPALDEQPAAGREEDAVVFAEWCANNYSWEYDPTSDEYQWLEANNFYTTAELYTIFKQQKENP